MRGRGRLVTINAVTRILDAMEKGDPHAAAQLLPLVYDEWEQRKRKIIARQALEHFVSADQTGGVFRLIQKSVGTDHLLVQTDDAAGKINGSELIHPGRKAKILGAGFALQYAEMVHIQ